MQRKIHQKQKISSSFMSASSGTQNTVYISDYRKRRKVEGGYSPLKNYEDVAGGEAAEIQDKPWRAAKL